MKARFGFLVLILVFILAYAPGARAAYHHEGEQDSDKFLEAYPDLKGTKLDHCATCHSGGSIETRRGTMTMGSCTWCHDTYGYDGAGEIDDTMNQYGIDYKASGRNADAVEAIADQDSDGDGYTNQTEIESGTYPGDANDHPGLEVAPARVYTKAQLEEMTQHTQFMLMNTSRSGDSYAEYTGVPMRELLDDAGISPEATDIIVYAPDGWSQTHPLNSTEGNEKYHVYGNMAGEDYQYPPASYHYDPEADAAVTEYGWCDYSAPGCAGRSDGDPIFVENGLKAILALQHNGTPLEPGVLNEENKLDGEGPFRVIVPQKSPNPPDQSSRADKQDVIWPYTEDWDHNAGACTKSSTIIKAIPLPEGQTDINIYEAGWQYVDEEKIIIYGAIDGTDSNGNGILDSEEGTDMAKDVDEDGTPDYMDTDTARFRHQKGLEKIRMHCSAGDFANVQTLMDDDPMLSQTGKPDMPLPYGAVKFHIAGLSAGESVTVSMTFPADVPTTSKYYKITSSGWQAIEFGSNDGDATIELTLTDGDPATDLDGTENGVIVDPGALAVGEETGDTGEDDDDDDDDTCFIQTLISGQ
jgi:hypothetical protein